MVFPFFGGKVHYLGLPRTVLSRTRVFGHLEKRLPTSRVEILLSHMPASGVAQWSCARLRSNARCRQPPLPAVPAKATTCGCASWLFLLPLFDCLLAQVYLQQRSDDSLSLAA
jgi:hypothetical protein